MTVRARVGVLQIHGLPWIVQGDPCICKTLNGNPWIRVPWVLELALLKEAIDRFREVSNITL